MANKLITQLVQRSEVSDSCNFATDDTTQSFRVTAPQIYEYMRTKGVVDTWLSTRTYSSGDLIYYGNLLYQSTTGSNLNNTPGSNDKWMLYLGQKVEAKTATFTIDDYSCFPLHVFTVNGSGTDVVAGLPDRAKNINKRFIIMQTGVLDSDGTGNISVTRAGSDVIGPDSETSIKLCSKGDKIVLWAGPTRWEIESLRQVEYCYNSTTNNADNTTDFAYGPGGGLVLQSTATANRLKRIRFLESMTRFGAWHRFEIDPDANGHWSPMTYIQDSSGDQVCQLQRQNATLYGTGGFFGVSGSDTDIDVFFGQYANAQGTTYASAGSNWSSSIVSKYRIAKYRII